MLAWDLLLLHFFFLPSDHRLGKHRMCSKRYPPGGSFLVAPSMFLSTLMSSHVDVYLPTLALAWCWKLWSRKNIMSCSGEWEPHVQGLRLTLGQIISQDSGLEVHLILSIVVVIGWSLSGRRSWHKMVSGLNWYQVQNSCIISSVSLKHFDILDEVLSIPWQNLKGENLHGKPWKKQFHWSCQHWAIGRRGSQEEVSARSSLFFHRSNWDLKVTGKAVSLLLLSSLP